jgi:hypothetical protein
MNIKGFIEDLRDTIAERIKNPFIVSFIISWLACNWSIIYILLNFDDSMCLGERMDILTKYVSENKDRLAWTPFWKSIIVAGVYIGGSAIFFSIFNVYNSLIKSFLFRVTTLGKNIPKERFFALNKKYIAIKNSSEEFQSENIKLEEDLKLANANLNASKISIAELDKRISNFITERAENETKSKELIDQLNHLKEMNTRNLGRPPNTIITGESINPNEIFLPNKIYQLAISDTNMVLKQLIPSNYTFMVDSNKNVLGVGNDAASYSFEEVRYSKSGILYFKLNSKGLYSIPFYMFRQEKNKLFKGFCSANDVYFYCEISTN